MVLNPLDEKGFFDYMVEEAAQDIGIVADSAEVVGEAAIDVGSVVGDKFVDVAGGAVDLGKKGLAVAVGFMDAVVPFKVTETPLPWSETSVDLDYKRSGYHAGMAANLVLAGGGTAMTGHGMVTASTCGSVALGGMVASETGVGAVVAAGGGVCVLEGLAEAGLGAVAALVGGSNLAKRSANYGSRREDVDNFGYQEPSRGRKIGGNRTKNEQFKAAGGSALKGAGIDPNSQKGKTILRAAHDIVKKVGGCSDFDDCAGIIWDVICGMTGAC